MDKTLHVFVCTTNRDLVSERNAVLDALESLTDQFSGFTFHCPRSIQPLEVSKEEIGRSDVLVMITGHLQGVMAPGLDSTHEESEYDEGYSLGKPVLVYLRGENAALHPAHYERDPARAARLKSFRDKLASRHPTKVFDDIYSLVSQVSHDLYRLAMDSGLKPKSGPKTTKLKARAWETRKLPTAVGATLLPQDAGQIPGQTEAQTRTIPILQKALSTPFRRRRSSGFPMGKALLAGAAVLALAGFALARLHKTPFLKLSHALPASPAAEAAQANPAAATAPQAAPEPVAPPKPSGIVAVTDDGDTTKAFLRKATDGSPQDQFRVGEMYEQGKDVPRNDSLAFRWYRKAAEQGMAEAQYKLATLYRIGRGTAKSSYQSAHWFQAAAEQGNAKAQVKLGQMYRNGKGVPRNETMAFKWFLKAADQKDPEAEKIIAELKDSP